MLSIPAGNAQTSAVLALAMLVAPCITELSVAVFAAPAIVTLAGLAHTSSVLAALQVAQFCKWTDENGEIIKPLVQFDAIQGI